MSPKSSTDLHYHILYDIEFIKLFESDSFSGMFILEIPKYCWFRFVDYSLPEPDQVSMALQADPSHSIKFSRLYLARIVTEVRNTHFGRNESVAGWYHTSVYEQYDSNSFEIVEKAMNSLGWKIGVDK